MVNRILRYFREHPRMLWVYGGATLVAGLAVWFAFSGSSFQIGRFFASGTAYDQCLAVVEQNLSADDANCQTNYEDDWVQCNDATGGGGGYQCGADPFCQEHVMLDTGLREANLLPGILQIAAVGGDCFVTAETKYSDCIDRAQTVADTAGIKCTNETNPTPTPIGACQSDPDCLKNQVCLQELCIQLPNPTPTPGGNPTPGPNPILGGGYCGDGICNVGEDCPIDCGSGGGGGGAGSTCQGADTARCATGDCDGDGYINPGAPCASLVPANCLDSQSDANSCIHPGTANCPHTCDQVTGGGQTPTPTPGSGPTGNPSGSTDLNWEIAGYSSFVDYECTTDAPPREAALDLRARLDTIPAGHAIHVISQTSFRAKPSCSTSDAGLGSGPGNPVLEKQGTIDFNDSNVPGEVNLHYNTRQVNCGSVGMSADFRDQTTGIDYGILGVIVNYGTTCTGSGTVGGSGPAKTPTPGTVGAVKLSVVCGATQNVLSWTALPAGSTGSSILKNTDAGDGTYLVQGLPLTQRTFTDTQVQLGHSYSYAYKNSPTDRSNDVVCTNGVAVATTPVPTFATVPAGAPVDCEPKSQDVMVGQIGRVDAGGGNGVFSWDASGQGIQQDTGPTFSSYIWNVPGTKVVQALSGGQAAMCIVTVLSPVLVSSPTEPVAVPFATETPLAVAQAGTTTVDANGNVISAGVTTIPTGAQDAIILALAASAALTLLYAAYTRSPRFNQHEIERISKEKDPLDFRR